MAKSVVVLRKLLDQTFASAVIVGKPDVAADDVYAFLHSEAEDHIKEFCAKFPEFKREHFTIQSIETQ